MDIYPFSAGFIEKLNDFILRITFEKEGDISKENIQEITAIRKEIFGDIPYCSLIDLRKGFLTLENEALDYIAQHPEINKYRVAEALQVNNFGQKLGVDMYIRLFKPKRVSKIFFKEEKAKKWLKKEFEKFNSCLN